MRKIFILTLLFTSLAAKAQFYDAGRNWNVGINVGIDRFFGDVSPQSNPFFANPITVDFYKDRHFAGSVYFGKDIASFWFARINVLYCNLGAKNYTLNMETKISHVHELSMIHTFDIFGCFPRSHELENWDLNLSIGFGWLGFRSIRTDMETNKELQCTPGNYHSQPGAFKYVFSLPFGIGFGYRFARSWKFNFATNYRWIKDDLFDSYESDRKSLEGFAFLQVGVQYIFHFKNASRDTEDDFALERKSPNYRYRKNQLKNGYTPINSKKKKGAPYKTYHKRNQRS